MNKNPLFSLFLFLLISLLSSYSHASYLSPSDDHKSYLLAQATETDDTYDPFSDYSEFDEASEEEADIYFFRHGRFLSLGFNAGMRGFTGNLSTLYQNSMTYGLFMAFFFDMRFALQFGFNTGDYGYEFRSTSTSNTGNVSLTFINLGLKYFINTQNITRGLADLNPYAYGGFSQVYRTYTTASSSGSIASSNESTMGLDMGGGIEIPLMRKKAFFGVQFIYHYVQFRDESINIRLPDNTQTSTKPSGDTYDLLGIIGLNY
ncbi:MAG: hypothetical protein BroJett040_21390 [Oligoflexia bacterium]|nr:MAG: hypothetical protein BroJett040_21390 [Oligoflexia bacterium]